MMHEQLIREFVERAEAEVHLPDLATLELRGHHRRRNRQAAAAIAAVMAVAAIGIGILGSTGNTDRNAPAPSQDPGSQFDDPVPDKQVAAGREYRVVVFGQNYSDTIPDGKTIAARLTIVGQGWYWGRDAVAKFAPGSDPAARPLDPYLEVRFSMVDRVPVRQCPQETIRWRDGAADPLGLARQVAQVGPVEVLRAPRTTTWSGYPAAHLRLRVTELCEQWQDAVLWSVFPSSSRQTPGVGTVFRAGQVVDLWFVDVEGSNVVVSTAYSPGVPRALIDETSAIADSIHLEMVDE